MITTVAGFFFKFLDFYLFFEMCKILFHPQKLKLHVSNELSDDIGIAT